MKLFNLISLGLFVFLSATNQLIKIGPVKEHDNEIVITE